MDSTKLNDAHAALFNEAGLHFESITYELSRLREARGRISQVTNREILLTHKQKQVAALLSALAKFKNNDI